MMLDEIKSLRYAMEAGGVDVKWLELEDAASHPRRKHSDLAF